MFIYPGFTGEVRVAVADQYGDGRLEVLTTRGPVFHTRAAIFGPSIEMYEDTSGRRQCTGTFFRILASSLRRHIIHRDCGLQEVSC